jgi:hypothetical protein
VRRRKGDAVLTAAVDEVTRRTVLLRWIDDGSIRVKASAHAMRFVIADFRWVEKVE